MMMSRKLALITVLSLLVTHTTMASPNIVDLVLQSVASGSVTEMKSRILSLPISVCGAEDYRRAIAMLSLKLLGHDPADHLRGLRKLNDLTRRDGYNIDSRDYPSIGERTQFAQRFIALMA